MADLKNNNNDHDINNVDNNNQQSNMSDRSSKRSKNGDTKHKICSASCIAGGILGSGAILACTAAVCILYNSANPNNGYAVGFPNGDIIESMSTSVDDNGRPIIDIWASKGNDTESRPASSSYDKPVSSSSSSSMSDDKPVFSESVSSSSSNTNNSEPVFSSSSVFSSSLASSSSEPVIIYPDTGEHSDKITSLIERELLDAQKTRMNSGLSVFPDSDLIIAINDYQDIIDIASYYGFSEDFVYTYNNIKDVCPDIIRIPAVS